MRLIRAWLVLALLLSGNALALGLGDIRLSSALNEPLRARIELLSATPEELEGLKVQLASPDTFSRYGIDRPLWLMRLQFNVVRSASGGAVEIRSLDPITEPFVTFLVEASWASGRLLREYTVLLDPPTFAPPPATEAREAVTAPSRAAPADAGRIERPAARQPAPAPAARQPAATAGTDAFDTAAGGDVQVRRGDTLWGIAQRVRPDDRLNMNQTMLAIYEANPEAFAGNINRLEAGSRLRIPSADDIFRISRNDALSEVQRQNEAFGIAGPAPRTQPSLTLVPPDGEQEDYGAGATAQPTETGQRQAELQARIRELEGTVADQQSLLEIRDNELAQLRQELARMREQAAAGEQPLPADEPVAEEPVASGDEAPDEVFVEDDETAAEDEVPADTQQPVAEDVEPAPAEQPSARVVRTAPQQPGLIDRVVGMLTGIWGIIGLAVLVAVLVLLWFAKRAAGREEESTGVWEALDVEEDEDVESRASTERLRALARDDDASIVVVEQESAIERRRKDRGRTGDTVEVARREFDEETSETGAMPAFDDTFSSETAINLDQSDPIAEADFHMAYGLYDQAADLVNGALAVEPERQDLMAKLAEIYFVWGNRDAFVDAASRLHDQLGGEATPDWDKIVIMGQQLAPDHRLFSGVSAAGATRAVDLSFDDSGDSNVLDMDFDAGGPDGAVSEVVDLGAGEDESRADQSGLDFVFDEDEVAEEETGATTTREMPRRSRGDDESTVESPTIESRASDRTIESPTMERPMEGLDSTSELPAFRERDRDRESLSVDATAEIDLDDLGLDLDALAQSGLEDDGDDGDFGIADLEATSEHRALSPEDETGRNRSLDDDLDSTSEMPLASDEETGRNRAVAHDDTDVEFDSSLLDATGHTQVLSDDFGVNTTTNDDDATMLASFDEEEDKDTGQFSSDDMDFDFAETEALPKDTYSGSTDETGEMPQPGGDIDLDLEELTAALRTSAGDTVDQPRDDETVEQPVRGGRGYDGEDDTPTEALSPDDLSDDLHDARTMTEVGTKLDLARAYVDMGDPEGARSILEEVLDEGDAGQRQQAQKLIDSLPD